MVDLWNLTVSEEDKKPKEELEDKILKIVSGFNRPSTSEELQEIISQYNMKLN